MGNLHTKAQEINSKEEISLKIQQILNDKNTLKKLVNYTISLFKKYNIQISYMEPIDFVYNAFDKLLSGRRKWDKAKFPNILNFILIIIHSDIRNEIKKYSINEKGSIKYYYFESIYEENEEGSLKHENLVDTSIDLEINLVIQDTIERAANEIEKKGDEEAWFVLDCFVNGMKNREIAEYLNIEVSRVENAIKRIKRVIKK